MKNNNVGLLGISFILFLLSPLVGLVWLIDTYLFPPYWILIVASGLFAAFILMLVMQYKMAPSNDAAGGVAMGGFFASAGFLIAMAFSTSIIGLYYLAKHIWL